LLVFIPDCTLHSYCTAVCLRKQNGATDYSIMLWAWNISFLFTLQRYWQTSCYRISLSNYRFIVQLCRDSVMEFSKTYIWMSIKCLFIVLDEYEYIDLVYWTLLQVAVIKTNIWFTSTQQDDVTYDYMDLIFRPTPISPMTSSPGALQPKMFKFHTINFVSRSALHVPAVQNS